MNIDRLRKIIEYSEKNRTQMDSKVAKFYSFTGISEDKDMLNILQIVRPALRQRGYIVLEIPFADEEIGALCYHGDALGYILINTSLPRVNANFAICHEIYHAFYPQNEFKAKAEFADDYFEHEEEYEANIFAGMLLMPESSFRQMYRVFRAQSDNNEMDTLIRLMNYYQVPYNMMSSANQASNNLYQNALANSNNNNLWSGIANAAGTIAGGYFGGPGGEALTNWALK